MWLAADLDLGHGAGDGVDAIDDVVEAPRQPQRPAVGTDVAHVGTSAARDGPVRDDPAVGEIDHRDPARATALAVDLARAAVGNVQALAVATRIQAVRAQAGGNETDLPERITVENVHAVGVHVGDVEALAVGRDANVLGHALARGVGLHGSAQRKQTFLEARARHGQLQVARHLATDQVDLGHCAVELAGEDRIAHRSRGRHG